MLTLQEMKFVSLFTLFNLYDFSIEGREKYLY